MNIENFRKFGVIFIALFMVLMLIGNAEAYSKKQVFARISATAGETVTVGQVVCIKDANGYAYKADANDAALRPAVGIVGSKTGASGAAIEIITNGILTGWTGLSEGVFVYLSETAGAITQSAPSYSQPIGVAISTTTIYFNCHNYFDSSALTAMGVLSGATPIIMEGATADDYETTITPTNPTADNTITLPDDSGAISYSPGVGTTVAADVLAIPVTHAYVAKTTGADAEALTLANGENGQILTVSLVVDGGGDGTLTPTTKSGFATIVFSAAGQAATLLYVDDTVGWVLIGLAGVAAAPVITI